MNKITCRSLFTTKTYGVLLPLTFFLLYTHHIHAQSQERLYSLLIVNFAKGIQWPVHSNESSFVIGVLEYPPLAAELNNAIPALKRNDKKVEIKEYANAEEIERCQILFIPAYKAKLMPYILNKLKAASTLIVTNKPDMAKNGSGINFTLANGKLQYEINCRSIEQRGMKVSSKLKGMGIVVE